MCYEACISCEFGFFTSTINRNKKHIEPPKFGREAEDKKSRYVIYHCLQELAKMGLQLGVVGSGMAQPMPNPSCIAVNPNPNLTRAEARRYPRRAGPNLQIFLESAIQVELDCDSSGSFIYPNF